jgi:multidrug efflux pump subunit AcrA (membrane-fusion protein)
VHDRTRRVLRRGSAVAVALLVVGGGTAGTWAATTGNGAGNYRTVAATTGNVEQLLTLTGTVAPVSEASATFAVSGTVTRGDVAVGDSVAAGQELATIDTKPLQDAVTQAEATLATAQETYAVSSDTSSASSSATGSSTTASGGGKSATGSSAAVSTGAVPVSQKSATTSRTGSSGTSSSGTGSADGGSAGGKTKDMDFSAETKAVDKASAEVATLSKAAARALSSASAACAASQTTDSTTPTPTSTPVPTTSSPPTTPGTGSDPRTSCLAALSTVAEAQSAVANAQSALSAAQSTFGSILTGGAASLQKSGSGAAGATSTTPVTGSSIGAPTASAPAASVATTAAATPTAAAKSAATPSGGGGTAGASSAGDTASRVADANVSVLEAQNALQVARDALASATLTAPISGTVVAVPFVVGDTVGTSNALTIVGTGAVRVTVNVPLASLPKVKVGQNTRVTASGATKPVGGKIESVAILPVSGTTTFPVTVLVAEPAAALASGSSATASIVLSTLTDVVTVPNSALTRTGTGTAAVVTVSSDGTVSRKQVALGAVGALSSQVQSGLKAGDQVVLADLSQAVPANSTTSTVRGAGGGGIPPGGAGAGGRPTG